ncbi:hypothetical protein GPAL_0338 [Glaciecola pallidula DSM 14239 = ACAM 615]|uniref:Uncharacterized protein n=1 Tax=Brumicola pallidula DSM 14239 = ACAM 615 TaxID=1121922 RepID=K6ZE48_9ALTE|nr:hypothetical protein GPAL_0338 [Glaciecola pallidula DSM 14239 = ACAM 615]
MERFLVLGDKAKIIRAMPNAIFFLVALFRNLNKKIITNIVLAATR